MDLDYEDSLDIQFYIDINNKYNQFKCKQIQKECILSKSPNVSHINTIPPLVTTFNEYELLLFI